MLLSSSTDPKPHQMHVHSTLVIQSNHGAAAMVTIAKDNPSTGRESSKVALL